MMRPTTPIRFMLLAAGLALLLVIGADGALAKKAKPGEGYLLPAEIAGVVALPAPPPKASSAEQAEIMQLLRIEAERSVDAARAAEDDAERTLTRFLTGTGIVIPLERTPHLNALMAAAAAELRHGLDGVKDIWQRPRPFVTDARLRPCERNRPSSQSYPSAHAALGALYGQLLSEVMPARRQALTERAQSYGWSRVICGFHYPSDVAAGRDAGVRMANALLANAEFRAELEAARAEVQALGGQ